MADTFILGLLHEATPTADTIEQLRELGISDDRMTVMSSTPYRPEMLGRHPHYERLVPIALIGAASGFLAALFLTVGTPLLYSLYVGGQPLIPIPPTLIILFEFTMLGTMVATFAGLVAEITFPKIGGHFYDSRITEGHIGVLVRVRPDLAARVEEILVKNGAHHLQRTEPPRMFERQGSPWERARARVGPRGVYALRWVLILVFLAIPTTIGMLLAYSFFSAPLPNQMVDQSSVAFDQGPRLAAPVEAVPVQGPVLIGDQPATEPLPATANSLQRGRVRFGLTCTACHGQDGAGDGKVGVFFNPRPANLTSATVQKLSDAELFVVITQGIGSMPSMAENLSVADRWNVINHLREMQQ